MTAREGPSRRLVPARRLGALLVAAFALSASAAAGEERPPLPTALRIGEGELRLGLLAQAWYYGDDSEEGSGTSYLGNPTGVNTFRIRRVEIKLYGTVTRDWGFEVMFDPAKKQDTSPGGDDRILQDFGISYLGLSGHTFTLGQAKIALTEEGLRSSSDLDFVERSKIARVLGDQRQMGLFYRGDFGPKLGGRVSITTGSPANVAASSDGLFWAARVDAKPVKGLVAGVSGGTGANGEGSLTRDRLAAHARWEGTERLPLLLRAEAGSQSEEQPDGSEVQSRGFYVSGLYTFSGRFRVGLRYEEYDPNRDVGDDELSVVTAGVHWMIRGRTANLKAEWYAVDQKGRTVDGEPDERYGEFVFAAQISF